MPPDERRKAKPDAARSSAPASPSLGLFHSLAYIPFPGRKPGKKRDLRGVFAMIAAAALAAAAVYFRPAPEPATIPAVDQALAMPVGTGGTPELPKINAVVVDHYNAMLIKQRRPDLHSNKVQFINGVYSVVPNSWGPGGPPPPDSKR